MSMSLESAQSSSSMDGSFVRRLLDRVNPTSSGARERAHHAPGPVGDPFLGHLLQVRKLRLEFFQRCLREYGDLVRFQVGGGAKAMIFHVASHPEHVHQVLVEQHRKYSRETRGYEVLRMILGNGLVTSDGSFWLRQRRIMQPAFHRDRIASFASTMVHATEEMLQERWRPRILQGRPLDTSAEFMRLTLRIVSLTLLGTDLSESASVVGDAIDFLQSRTQSRINAPFDIPLHIPTPDNVRIRRSLEAIDGVILPLIQSHREAKEPSGDLLSMLLAAKDEETGESMNDQQLRDEVITIFLAGHETTANALMWTFVLLSKHPDVARKLHGELRQVLQGRAPTLADLPHLAYTKMVLQESMRLFPPAWMIGRRAEEADVLDGYEIPKHSVVLVSPMLVHHNPRVWTNPEGFDPERFSPERAASIPRFAYFPFGAGPHQCIGNNFALMEAQLILATIAQQVELDLLPGLEVQAETSITLRPQHHIKMQGRWLEPRSEA